MSSVERGVEGELFLKAMKGVWDDHLSIMSKLRDVLKYMVSLINPTFGREDRMSSPSHLPASLASSRLGQDLRPLRQGPSRLRRRPLPLSQAHRSISPPSHPQPALLDSPLANQA